MLGAIFAIVATLILGAINIINKKILHRTSVLSAISIRYGLMTFFILLMTSAFATIKIPEGAMLTLIAANSFVGAIALIMFFKALKEMDVSIAAAMSITYSALVLLGAIIFLNERFDVVKLTGILVVIWSAVAISTELKGKRLELGRGSKYMAVAIVCWAIYYLIMKIIVASLGPFNATLWSEGLSGFWVAALFFIIKGKRAETIEKYTFGLLFISSFAVAVSAILYNLSIESVGVAISAAIVSANPVVTEILGRIFLKERLPLYKQAAIVIMIGGIAMLSL